MLPLVSTRFVVASQNAKVGYGVDWTTAEQTVNSYLTHLFLLNQIGFAEYFLIGISEREVYDEFIKK